MSRGGRSSSALAMMVTAGMEDFLVSALANALRAGFSAQHIHIFHSPDVQSFVEQLQRDSGFATHPFTLGKLGRDVGGYRDYGTEAFGELQLSKLDIFPALFANYELVLYSDLDVAWIRDPWPYLDKIFTQYDVAVQTEAVDYFPPFYCTGLIAAKCGAGTKELFAATRARLEALHRIDRRKHDQDAFNEVVREQRDWWNRIFALPEGLFPNGLLTSILAHPLAQQSIMAGKVSPYAYHANWTIGTANKRELLKAAGLWRSEDADVISARPSALCST